jgi:hypothetical protein
MNHKRRIHDAIGGGDCRGDARVLCGPLWLLVPGVIGSRSLCEIDMEQCPHCGGTLEIIAAIEHHVIAKILTHLGLSAGHRPDPQRGHSMDFKRPSMRAPLSSPGAS